MHMMMWRQGESLVPLYTRESAHLSLSLMTWRGLLACLGDWGPMRVFKLKRFVGSAERLAWAKANGCSWESSRTCAVISKYGIMAVLRWAREHGCPWDPWTCACAAPGRASGGATVGAGARVPVGCVDAHLRRYSRAPARVEVGAGALLPVE
jgi:hypothetical protein